MFGKYTKQNFVNIEKVDLKQRFISGDALLITWITNPPTDTNTPVRENKMSI